MLGSTILHLMRSAVLQDIRLTSFESALNRIVGNLDETAFLARLQLGSVDLLHAITPKRRDRSIAQEFHDDSETQCVILTGNDNELSSGIDLSDPAMPDVAVRMTKQNINSFANVLNQLGSHMDVDQAMLCGNTSEAKNGRSTFSKD